MTGFKKLVGVTLAVVLVAAVAAFVLRPNTGPNTSAVINDPEADDPGTDPAANDPPKPERLSNGPNHQVCVPQNDHIPEHAWVRGANWYRFYEFAACSASALVALVIN